VLDTEDRTAFVNDRMAEMLGCSRDEVVGRSVYDFLHEGPEGPTRAALARRRDGVAELREVQLRGPDGMPLHVFVESSPLLDEDGRYAGAVGMVTDITARKQVEREVSMLAALVQSSSDAIIACSLEGTVQSWNPAAEGLFGYSASEITGRPLSMVLQSGDEGVLRLLDTTAAGKLAGPYEVEAVAKDRTYVPVELTAFPVDDGVGRVTAVAVTMRDVRERRETERLIRDVERARLDAEKVGRLGTFDWFIDTNEVIWSDEAWRIHGRTPEGGPPPVGYMDAVHPDDRDALHQASVTSATTLAPLDLRYRIVLPDGDVRWIHSHAETVQADGEGGRRMAGTVRDVTELVRAEETLQETRAELRRQALHDQLTSLPNRTLLVDRLSVALAHAERNRCAVAAIVVNIDRFSLVNEELGHEFGDQVLKAVGQRLAGLLRAGDTVGRLSGDEFAILCEGIEPDKRSVDAMAERVVDGFGTPFAVGGQEVYLAASVGASWADQVEGAETLLTRAMGAMQAAKDRERGSFVVVEPGRDSRPYTGRGRLALRHALRDALENDQLRVVYQPIVGLGDERPRAFEALLRWDHPGLGPVSPLEFIPIAEDTGLILPIGEWVLNQACDTLAALEPGIAVTVNLSARQLLQQDLVSIVRRAVERTGVNPDRLVLELTESMLVDESEQVEETLGALKEIGVQLALDDFGTGYSALGYLKRFPFDIVKVDRSFVHGLGRDEGDSAIVGAVLGMAKALGMQVVAEGIETKLQLSCLNELGASLGQGFYFARPGPVPERN
jgi:diguanylate cyclase (GGDEF)-like protein/PAS domain S-box-containing protein